MRKARVGDRMSGLPDPILYHMLSFLPTKYAARTSVLSTRWRNLWAYVPSLDFEHKDTSDVAGFMNSIDRVLIFRNSSDIQKFRLHWSFHLDCKWVSNRTRLDGWILSAIRCNAVELDLDLCISYWSPVTFELPKSVFMGKTLVVLKMKSNVFTFNPPASGCFPSLKLLDVAIERPYGDSAEMLFTCCPVLEDLRIDVTLHHHVWNLKVSTPELKMLRITLQQKDPLMYPLSKFYKYNIFINAPKLENFDLKQDIMPNYFWENSKSLVKASVNLHYHYAHRSKTLSDRAAAFLAGISNVKCLSLSAHVLEDHCLPAFDNLSELKLVLHDCHHWKLLIDLLHRSPNLEHLVIEHKGDKECHKDDSKNEMDGRHKPSVCSEHLWNTPESVPACLISHLKTIIMREFKGYPHEKKAAKFLLENARIQVDAFERIQLSLEFDMQCSMFSLLVPINAQPDAKEFKRYSRIMHISNSKVTCNILLKA